MKAIKSDLFLCLKNDGYEASLERRKIYRALPDRAAAVENLIRVVDESGEDYLFPVAFFAPVKLSPSLRRAILAAV